MPVISLLTDFGLADAYVGIMKGVMLSVAPGATIVDISHQVSPQNLIQAAYLIDTAYGFFPRGTLHVVVVDPGVGSLRRILAIEAAGHTFLAPDNGVLTRVLERVAIARAVAVENERFFLSPVSPTFHGRDIFAPVAGHLICGVPLYHLGPGIAPDTLVRLDLPSPVVSETGELTGTIIDIDRFGNLITNIDAALLASFCSEARPEIFLANDRISGLSQAYSAVAPGTALGIIGSRGLLEISVNQGSARDVFTASIGDPVQIIKGLNTR